jgi:RecA-family ATPase
VASAAKPEALPVVPAAEVPPEPERSGWLVEGLWSREAVGLIGGAPKCGKTWLALDLAVSVASGTPALGRFSVREPGPVLFYGAEDAPPQLRERLLALAASRDLPLDALALGLILCEGLRLDTEPDLARLAATLERHRPRLLILDPLVRLHRIDE